MFVVLEKSSPELNDKLKSLHFKSVLKDHIISSKRNLIVIIPFLSSVGYYKAQIILTCKLGKKVPDVMSFSWYHHTRHDFLIKLVGKRVRHLINGIMI